MLELREEEKKALQQFALRCLLAGAFDKGGMVAIPMFLEGDQKLGAFKIEISFEREEPCTKEQSPELSSD